MRRWRIYYLNDNGWCFAYDDVYADCYDNARRQRQHPMGEYARYRCEKLP